jgi:hypothetical protein
MPGNNLPGADLVEQGCRDLAEGVESIEAFLVSIAAARLKALGINVPHVHADPEIRLYLKLSGEFGDAAHSRYNALLRQLVSFQRAARA